MRVRAGWAGLAAHQIPRGGRGSAGRQGSVSGPARLAASVV